MTALEGITGRRSGEVLQCHDAHDVQTLLDTSATAGSAVRPAAATNEHRSPRAAASSAQRGPAVGPDRDTGRGEHGLGRALADDQERLRLTAVPGRHPPAHGVEGQRTQPRVAGPDGPHVDPAAAGPVDERGVDGIGARPGHIGSSGAVLGCVVGQNRRPGELVVGVLLGVGPGLGDPEPALGERPGLVRREQGHRPEGFDRRQAAGDRVPRGHAPGPEGEPEGDHDRQRLGHGRDREAQRGHEHQHRGLAAGEPQDEHDPHATAMTIASRRPRTASWPAAGCGATGCAPGPRRSAPSRRPVRSPRRRSRPVRG